MENYLITSLKSATTAFYLAVMLCISSASLLGQTLKVEFDVGFGPTAISSGGSITGLCNNSNQTVTLIPSYCDAAGVSVPALGSFFRWTQPNGVVVMPTLPTGELVIDINSLSQNGFYCLLYTSPSPRDGLLSRMPSSA